MRILFQGDSITDSNRKYEEFYDLGNGYAYFTAQGLQEALPAKSWNSSTAASTATAPGK